MHLGDRLKAERERLGYSQPALAALVAASTTSQQGWERGTTQPNSAYLLAMAAVGIDVIYVLSGERPSDEMRERMRSAALHAINAGTSPVPLDVDQINAQSSGLTLDPPISAREIDLVQRLRGLNAAGQQAVEAMVMSLATGALQRGAAAPRQKQVFHGPTDKSRHQTFHAPVRSVIGKIVNKKPGG